MSAESVGQIGLDLVVNQNQFDRQMRGITNIASKAGKVLAGAFAIKKITEFTSACLDLGSDLAEVQNVVDVTFSKMNEQVNNFAQNAVFQFGLSETMAKKYTGTFGAMAKAFGFAENEAYAMSTTLTGLAGDVASFYNITQDEAYTKLKSVFSGETETLKDLGIVMTQTALDQYALANGYGKTTSAMTEQEKVALRYAFVQQQLALAQGDFARTSDSWANQVRILKLQFDSLRASLGQGFIAALTPVIKVINTVMGKLVQLANVFSAFMKRLFGVKSDSTSGIGSVTSDVSSATTAMDNLSNSTSGVGGAAKKAAKEIKGLMGIDEINTISSTGSEGDSGSGSGGVSGVGDIGMDNWDFSQQESSLDSLTGKVEAFADKVRSVFKNITNFIKKHKEIILSIIGGLISGIVAFFIAGNWGAITGAIANVIGWIELIPTALGLAGLALTTPAALIAGAVAAITTAFLYLWQTSDSFRQSLIDGWNALVSALTPYFQSIMGALKLVGDFLITILKPILFILWDAWCTVVDNIVKITMSLWTNCIAPVVQFLGECLKKIIDGLSEIWQAWKPTIEKIGEILVGIWNTCLKPVVNWLGNEFIQAFRNVGNYIKPILDNLKTMFGGLVDFIVGVFTGNWQKAWQGVQNIFKGIFDGLANIAKKPINSIIDAINTMIKGLNKIKLPDWIPGLGGKGINIPTIPKLAKGGIVDAPTIAMVGEAGKEAVMPLENNTGWITDLANKVAERLPSQSSTNNNNDQPIN
ncbi:phage tail protein, partial [uncultured Clostridium sp.]|uniref:phage tail protein n=1 Tax=uncultured Clostridium sp. TaxID=59620 RepID=UPI000B196E6B